MKILVTGGAGFIGSHLCDHLLARGDRLDALDNLLLGRVENIAHHLDNPGFRFVECDLLDIEPLRGLFRAGKYDVIFHMAANSDIRRSADEPDLDLRLNVHTTCNVLDCMRRFGVRQIIFPSSSTVYGSREGPLAEDSGPLLPVSLYGAGKLSAEAFLCAYASMFGLSAWIFRLPNVIGSRMTHGCIHDFIARLRDNPARLRILGDGRQSKPYVLVEEVIDAMLLGWERSRERINLFNIGVDSVTSVSTIAQTVVEEMGLRNVRLEYGGGDRGWVGDVPRFQYDLARIHALGWKARHTSDEAVRLGVRAQLGWIERDRNSAGEKRS